MIEKINAIAFMNWCVLNNYHPMIYSDPITGGKSAKWILHAIPEMSGAIDPRLGIFTTGELYEIYINYLNGK